MMNILLLSPYPEEIIGAFGTKDMVEVREGLDIPYGDKYFDWIVSYGCRTIIKEPWLSAYKGRIVNIHIGLLPFNRGADPNFWSWFEGTPKGITVHQIDAGIDTGPVYSRGRVNFKAKVNTLRSTYEDLKRAAVFTFTAVWPSIRDGHLQPYPQEGSGTYHRAKDKEPWFSQLPLGFDTPVEDVIALGIKSRCQKQSV